MKLESRDDIRKFKGKKAGLVKQTFTHARSKDLPNSVFNVSVSYTDFDYLEGVGDVSLRPGASKRRRADAQKAAVGEVVERYGKYYPHETNTEKVEDEDYLWLEENQSEKTVYGPLEIGEKVRHIEGTLLESGKKKQVPAQYVISTVDEERNYGYAFSVGMATTYSISEGLEHGIAEQLERDLAIKAWNDPSSLVKINSNDYTSIDFDADLYHVRNMFDAPMVLAVSYVDGVPCFSFGLEEELDESVVEALVENVQVYSNVRGELIQGSNPFPETAERSTVEERFSKAGDEVFETKTLPKVVQNVKEQFNPVGFDLTPPDIRQNGFRVTKVIVPKFRQFSKPEPMFTGNERFRYSDKSVPPFFHH